MLHNFSRIFIILLSFAVYGSSDPNPTLYIEETKLIGSYHENGEVEMFLGLPFARPPVGEMRWKKPHPWMPIPEEEPQPDVADAPLRSTAVDSAVTKSNINQTPKGGEI